MGATLPARRNAIADYNSMRRGKSPHQKPKMAGSNPASPIRILPTRRPPYLEMMVKTAHANLLVCRNR